MTARFCSCITSRGERLPGEFGNWNSVWKRFWRLAGPACSKRSFQILAESCKAAHLVYSMAPPVAAKLGAKSPGAVSHSKSTPRQTSQGYQSFHATGGEVSDATARNLNPLDSGPDITRVRQSPTGL
jgi:hypothetical protein